MKKIKTVIGLSLISAMFLMNVSLTQAAVTWTQTDWSAGDGQPTWSDPSMYDSSSGDGVYDTATANQLTMKINASTVVGQANFTTGTSQSTSVSGVSAYGLNNPISSIVAGSKFIIADPVNNRVLIYNSIPTSLAVPADVVVGQVDFTHNSANQGSTVDANTLNAPRGLYSDGTKLFIADSGNNRVLIFNTIPVANNILANVVIGQADFTHNTANRGGAVAANTLSFPDAITSDGTKLFINDDVNNRVLIFNTIPVANGVSADVAVGQPGLVSGSSNNGGLGDDTLYYPRGGIAVAGTKLIISDTYNNRMLIYNTIPVVSGASASVVIGQADFIHNAANRGGAVAANTLNAPFGIYSDGTKLYVADGGNNRALVYNTIPVANDASADVAVGQADLTHNSSGVTQSAISLPMGIFSNGTKLFLSDFTNSRVLVYNTIPVSSGVLADVVVGQPNFISSTANNTFSFSSDTSLYNPMDSIVVGSKLIVADASDNRVLIYNTIPTSNNAPADVVIGQIDMTHNAVNQGGSVAANTLNGPVRPYSDGTKLFIVDRSNNRVLIYNTIPVANNASADVVIGQVDFMNNAVNQGGVAAANTLSAPYNVSSDGTKLFIADQFNNRVLIYNTIPVSNDASANVVVGQVDMAGATVNQGLGSNVTAQTLYQPASAFSDGVKFYVSDTKNNRVLIYNTVPVSNNASADIVIGQADFNSCRANRGAPSFFGTCNTANSTGVAANTLYFPYEVYADGIKLYILDYSNQRVLTYNTIPTSNDASADGVIGQPNFTSMSANQGGTTAANTLALPAGINSSDLSLYVADYSNNRLLIYSGSHSSTVTSSIYDAGTPYTWGPLTYTATTGENTAVSFEVSTDDGATWEAVTNYTTQTFGPSNTVAYRATFSNTDGISTPTLTNVSIPGGVVASLITGQATNITKNSATLNGEMTDTGGSDAIERGFEYGKTTSYGSITTEASGPYGIGLFTANLTNLNCGTTYHYRAYATSVVGTGYGDDFSFDTVRCPSSGGAGFSGTTSQSSSPVIPSAPAPSCLMLQTLRQGSKGEEVKCLQTKLNSNLIIDGMFGPLTKASVIQYQLSHNLVGDGIVGPLTREVLGE
ncbi:MAG: peptidoglycan-binding protein [Candidatus Paceibacterota bacterium]|jgi:peptidoglycan hydrolase-like protein with peptidoglycan-binding domain